jgi:hypothetical protein
VGNPRKRIIDPAGRRASIYYNYRLRPHQLDRLLQQQAGSCAICRAAFTTTPYVDHCHTTGTVRGLLCRPCNALLAAFDKEGFLDRATAYLRSVDERCGWITSG